MTGEHVFPMAFGKYKGYCARCVAGKDPQYARWCLAQEWFGGTYPVVRDYWLSLGIVPLARCSALTREGNPCTFFAVPEFGDVCRRHFNRDSAGDFSAWELEFTVVS